MIHRDIVSTPGCISAASTAPTTHFTSPIAPPLHILGSVNPAPFGPPSVDLEACRAQVQASRARLIQTLRRHLAIEERIGREVAAQLEISAAIEADKERIDCILRHITGLKQDIEQWERAGIHVDGGEHGDNWEIQYSLDELSNLEERLALNRQRRDDYIARMAQSRDETERHGLRQKLRQELRDAQGGAVDEEEAHEAVVLNEQFQDVAATCGDIQNQVEEGPAGELAPPVLMSVEEIIGEPALNSPERQTSAMESLDHLRTNSPEAALPILEVQHVPISPTTTAPIVNQPTQVQPTSTTAISANTTPSKSRSSPTSSHQFRSSEERETLTLERESAMKMMRKLKTNLKTMFRMVGALG